MQNANALSIFIQESNGAFKKEQKDTLSHESKQHNMPNNLNITSEESVEINEEHMEV